MRHNRSAIERNYRFSLLSLINNCTKSQMHWTYGNSASDSYPPSDSARVNNLRDFKNLKESPLWENVTIPLCPPICLIAMSCWGCDLRTGKKLFIFRWIWSHLNYIGIRRIVIFGWISLTRMMDFVDLGMSFQKIGHCKTVFHVLLHSYFQRFQTAINLSTIKWRWHNSQCWNIDGGWFTKRQLRKKTM